MKSLLKTFKCTRNIIILVSCFSPISLRLIPRFLAGLLF
uniref:Uncharacterized protein n=1 Tax=Arundo donax TaxID=35708 RepID=A0A0A9GM10_ARUDO